jgi:hypothetical protein
MTPIPGDFGVQRSNNLAGRVIRVATRSHFNHAFVVIEDGMVVEAQPGGAVIAALGDRTGVVYSTGSVDLHDSDRTIICRAAKALVGTPYGWLDIASIGLLQYGVRLKPVRDRVLRRDELICSQLVDTAYAIAGVHLFQDGRLPLDVTPGDLAKRIGWK